MTKSMKNATDLNIAFIWIRDGVLVNRMPINAVAFAYSYFLSSSIDERRSLNMSDLVNFAFAQSGISCIEKMTIMRASHESSVDVETATRLYNILSTDAATKAQYFDGALNLLRWLKARQIPSFITSAVEQEVLDIWATSEQGKHSNGEPKLITEILGRRPAFCKGRDHFQYVSDWLIERSTLENSAEARSSKFIYYVADAVFEIKQGSEFAQDFSIVPIGFANHISSEQVLTAAAVLNDVVEKQIAAGVIANPNSVADLELDAAKLVLPSSDLLEASLRQAGAKYVVRNFSELLVIVESTLLE